MISKVQRLLDDYLAWLRDQTSLRKVGNQWVEITTPYLDRHNDHIQIYTRKKGDGFLLTDGGATIGDLERSGCKGLLGTTLNGFDVQCRDGSLEVHASSDDFALRLHNLVQAILAVSHAGEQEESEHRHPMPMTGGDEYEIERVGKTAEKPAE